MGIGCAVDGHVSNSKFLATESLRVECHNDLGKIHRNCATAQGEINPPSDAFNYLNYVRVLAGRRKFPDSEGRSQRTITCELCRTYAAHQDDDIQLHLIMNTVLSSMRSCSPI